MSADRTPTDEQIADYYYALSVFEDLNLWGQYYVSIPGDHRIKTVTLPEGATRLASIIATYDGVELGKDIGSFVPWYEARGVTRSSAEDDASFERQMRDETDRPAPPEIDEEAEELYQQRLKSLRASERAQETLARERADENYAGSIEDDDDSDDEDQAEPLVDLLIGHRHKVIFAGLGGTGKSTGSAQLAGDLVDGKDWLDHFPTHLPEDEHVGYINLEMTSADMRDKLRRMGIRNRSRIHVVTRNEGQVAFTGRPREDMLDWIFDKDITVLIVDSLRGIFDGDSIEDNTQLEHFYRRARSFMTDADLRALIIDAHSPKSTPDDVLGGVTSVNWADEVIMLRGIRDQPRRLHLRTQRVKPWLHGEVTLEYDENTERSKVVGSQSGSPDPSSTPTSTQKLTKVNRVVWAVGDNPGAGVRDLRGKRLKADYMVDSYNLAEEQGLIVRKPGRGTTIHHYLTDRGQARYEELRGHGLIP